MSINEQRGRHAAAEVFALLSIRPEELVDVPGGSALDLPRSNLILERSAEPVVLQAPDVKVRKCM